MLEKMAEPNFLKKFRILGKVSKYEMESVESKSLSFYIVELFESAGHLYRALLSQSVKKVKITDLSLDLSN